MSSALHAPVLQMAPAQQSCPDPPQSAHCEVPLSQTNGSAQNVSPPLKPTQQASVRPPHATHDPPWQAANGAVHPTLPVQQASPILPQAPLMQPPAVQVPCEAEQVPAAATHVFVLLSQQPLAEQKLPGES